MNQERLQKVIGLMKAEDLSQTLVTGTAPLYYLTGLWVEPHERMIALYINIDGETVLFGNELFAIENPGVTYRIHTDVDDPVAELAAAVRPGKLGIDKDWPSRFLLNLMGKRSDVTPVYGSVPVDMARLFKDAAEKDAMIAASRINDEVIQRTMASIQEGMTEVEVHAMANGFFREKGANKDGAMIVGFGPNTGDPHHGPDTTRLKKGDVVTFDFFTIIDRYWADMTRTFCFGAPTDPEVEKVYEIVKKANEAAEAAVRPGISLAELDAIARDVITEAGYGPYFTHRLGHGIGLEVHEPPDVSSKSTEVFCKPGMVFSIEPGIYLPGRFGVRIEDLVMVTEDGCLVLNQAPKDFKIVE